MKDKNLEKAQKIYELAKKLPEEYQLIGAGMLMGLAAKTEKEKLERKGGLTRTI